MRSITYEQALADWGYLWSEYGEANDMTGGYVDQEDLKRLLLSPTKATACRCLCSQIEYWFQVGPDTSGTGGHSPDGDPRVIEIAERHGLDWRAS